MLLADSLLVHLSHVLINTLKAETEAANRQRQADQRSQRQCPPSVKPLTLQIEELMRSLHPALPKPGQRTTL